VESVLYSGNNLLERFHQSFFFYLLPSPTRYLSIAFYIPVVIGFAVALAAMISACRSTLGGDGTPTSVCASMWLL